MNPKGRAGLAQPHLLPMLVVCSGRAFQITLDRTITTLGLPSNQPCPGSSARAAVSFDPEAEGRTANAAGRLVRVQDQLLIDG